MAKMGKIIRNGINYSGGGGSYQDNIIYISQADYDLIPDDIKNNDGIEYRITDGNYEGTASNINYNNATSGLEATTVQTAIDIINAKLQWKSLDAITGVGSADSKYIQIPETCNEYKIIVGLPSEGGIMMEQTFPQTVRTISRTVQFGGFGNSTSGGYKVRCVITKDNKVFLQDAYNGATSTSDVSSTMRMQVAYR